MKNTYYQPTMMVVRLQHQGLLMQSKVTSATSDTGIILGGASSGNTGGVVRTKESNSIWDEEW